jgi:hypothetical protein
MKKFLRYASTEYIPHRHHRICERNEAHHDDDGARVANAPVIGARGSFEAGPDMSQAASASEGQELKAENGKAKFKIAKRK